MNTDNLITPEALAHSLKMAAGIKKKPGLMKSTVGYMELLNKYVERIVTAKEKGKFVVTHGTQQPLEIYEAMDVVGVFNEFWGVISDVVKIESVPEALSISLSTGTPNEVCSFFRNMDGLLHVGKWPKTDCLCLRHLLVRQRQGVPHAGPALRHPRLRHGAALLSVHAAGDGALEERAQAPDRLPGRADRQEAGLRPPEGDGAPVLPPHRARPRDRRARRPCPDADVRRMLRRRAAGASADVRHPGGRGLPGIAEGGARGARGQRRRRRPIRSVSG